MKFQRIFISALLLFVLMGVVQMGVYVRYLKNDAQSKSGDPIVNKTFSASVTSEKMIQNEQYWKDRLTSEQYYICRQKGTERPFTGKYWNHHEKGMYHCVACQQVLFDSESKFDSGTGWPSFTSPAHSQNVSAHTDATHGMIRTEITCSRCGAHLGHVFDDGPAPTGQRYCINSAALAFEAEKQP